MSDSELSVGDTVCWTSTSGGRTTTKRGTVVAIVPAGVRPTVYGDRAAKNRERLADRFGFEPYAYAIDTMGGGGGRGHVSYLVAVPGRTDRAKERLYWPRVADLEADGS